MYLNILCGVIVFSSSVFPITQTHTCTHMPHTHIWTHSYARAHTHIHAYSHIHTFIHTNIHTGAHTHTLMHHIHSHSTYTYAHTHTHMHTHAYVHVHTQAHTHIHSNQRPQDIFLHLSDWFLHSPVPHYTSIQTKVLLKSPEPSSVTAFPGSKGLNFSIWEVGMRPVSSTQGTLSEAFPIPLS